MNTKEFWSQSFGDEYHVRNRPDFRDRIPFWDSAIQYCTPASVLEVGCGPGWNLKAIQACAPNVDALGVDVNAAAVEEARQAGFEVHCTDALGIMGLYEPGSIDLVATCGMLIHVAPDDLPSVMKAITTVSGRFVLCVEYMSETEEEVLYRGHSGRLWRRPFGKLYQQLGLTLLSEGEAGGFDNCQYALLEKRQP